MPDDTPTFDEADIEAMEIGLTLINLMRTATHDRSEAIGTIVHLDDRVVRLTLGVAVGLLAGLVTSGAVTDDDFKRLRP